MARVQCQECNAEQFVRYPLLLRSSGKANSLLMDMICLHIKEAGTEVSDCARIFHLLLCLKKLWTAVIWQTLSRKHFY